MRFPTPSRAGRSTFLSGQFISATRNGQIIPPVSTASVPHDIRVCWHSDANFPGGVLLLPVVIQRIRDLSSAILLFLISSGIRHSSYGGMPLDLSCSHWKFPIGP